MESEILVQFREELGPAGRRRIAEELGCAFKAEIAPQGIWVVSIRRGGDLAAILERFRRMPEVAHAEPNGAVKLLEGGG